MAIQLHSASKINSKSIHMRTCEHKKLLSDRKSSYPKRDQDRYLDCLTSYWLPCGKQSLGIIYTIKHTFQCNTEFPPYVPICSLLTTAKSPMWDHPELEDTAKQADVAYIFNCRRQAPYDILQPLKQTGIFQRYLKISFRLSKILNALLFSRLSEWGHSVHRFTYQRLDYDLCGQCGGRITYFHFLLEFAY